MDYNEAAQMLKSALRGKDSETIFNLAVESLFLAEQEGKVENLLKEFPDLYEVVITFDRFFQSMHSR